MNTGVWIWLVGLVSILWIGAMPAGAGIADVKVTTDTSIDCSSMQTIARDLYRNCKTDEEKAIATWYFVRRTQFHWPHIPTRDSIDLINSYGFALCGYQSPMFCQICDAGGLKARTMHPPQHMIAEAFYGGAWHMFDCQVGWYALNRKGTVASCAEMKKDPTLVTKAVEEGRGSKPYFQCRDNVRSGKNYAAGARKGGPRKAPTRRLIINLRRGESITRLWGNEGKSWHKPNEKKWTRPYHGCTGQGIDSNDPVNWPYWKPYAQVRQKTGDRVVYGKKRYFGNGRTVYEPDLATGAFTDAVAKGGPKGIKAKYQDGKGPNLHPAEVGKPGSIIFLIDLPYVGVDAWLDMTALRKTDKDALTVYATARKGGWQKVWSAEKTGELKVEGVSLKKFAWFGHGYRLKFEMTAGANVSDVGVEKFRITTVFMNNMYALPYFMPGRNVIRVTAAKGADLKAGKLALDYAWEEQGKEKTLSKQIAKLPFECTVEVGGKELPRMKHVKLSVAP